MYKFVFLFFSCITYSQITTLKINSNLDNSTIENALIYSENDYLGMTNEQGEIKIESSFAILKVVRENFYDAVFSFEEIKKMNWRLKLQPITFIQLEEVVVRSTAETVTSIIDKIKASQIQQNNNKFKYYQSNVNFKFNTKTIFSFNNIIYPADGLKINDKNKIIFKGFKNSSNDKYNSNSEFYTIDDKLAKIPVRSSVYCSIGSPEISSILYSKLYAYNLEETDDFYLVKFFPKKKNSNLLYEGYFIIDRLDYGIIELEMRLAESKNNSWFTTTFDLKEEFKYQIVDDTFKFKFSKIEDCYFLESSSRILLGVQTKGNHIGAKLECRLYNEQTIDQSGLDFKSYDWNTHKIK